MKNLHKKFIVLISILILVGTNKTFAQVFREYTQNYSESVIKLNFDENHYTKISNINNSRVYVGNNIINYDNDDSQENITLNINLIYDTNEYQDIIILLVSETGDIEYVELLESHQAFIDIPAGTYDIICQFQGTQEHFVVKELIDITDNFTIDVDVAESSNYVSTKLYDENGNILEPGVTNTETGLPSGMGFYKSLYLNPVNSFVFTTFNYTEDTFEEDSIWDFYINNVSNRYSIIPTLIGVGFGENKYYFSKYNPLNGINTSFTFENEISDWVYHHEEFNVNLSESSYPRIDVEVLFNGVVAPFGFYMNDAFNPEEGFKIYLNNPIDVNPSTLLVYPEIKDDFTLIRGSAIVKENDNTIVYSSNSDHDLYYNSQNVVPFHSRFSFTSSNNLHIYQGNNVPIMTIGNNLSTDGNFIFSNSKGRFGESSRKNLSLTTVEAMQNGNVIFSGDYLAFLQIELPITGQIEISFSNTNFEIDGLTGKNITKLNYNATALDSPPSLRHLQFRNTEDKVTDRFTSASEGTVRLAAGDFYLNFDKYYFEYNPGSTINFYYTPYNQNNWTELELTEYPEYFQMPAFGDYYEASLSSIENTQENAWYDVRIICTDAAGNKQEQIISPAFKLNDTMGISEATKSNFTVYPNPFKDNLYIQLPETIKGNSTFRVTDLTGKTIHAENNNAGNTFVWNGSSLPKGIYILSIENNGKVIAKKVIKK